MVTWVDLLKSYIGMAPPPPPPPETTAKASRIDNAVQESKRLAEDVFTERIRDAWVGNRQRASGGGGDG